MPVKAYTISVYSVTVPTATKMTVTSNTDGWTGRLWSSTPEDNLYFLNVDSIPVSVYSLSQTIRSDKQTYSNDSRTVSAGWVSTPYHPRAYEWTDTLDGTTEERVYFQSCGQVFTVEVTTASTLWNADDPIFQMFINSLKANCG